MKHWSWLVLCRYRGILDSSAKNCTGSNFGSSYRTAHGQQEKYLTEKPLKVAVLKGKNLKGYVLMDRFNETKRTGEWKPDSQSTYSKAIPKKSIVRGLKGSRLQKSLPKMNGKSPHGLKTEQKWNRRCTVLPIQISKERRNFPSSTTPGSKPASLSPFKQYQYAHQPENFCGITIL